MNNRKFESGLNISILMLLLLLAACARAPFREHPIGGPVWPSQNTKPVNTTPTTVRSVEVSTQKVIPEAPWQFWSSRTFNNEALSNAELAISEGLLETAASNYREAIKTAGQSGVRDAARLRLAGTLLKMNRSEEALEEISAKNAEVSGSPENLNSRFAIVAAYAYLQQRNLDQSLAWFSVASKGADRANPISLRSEEAVSELLNSVTELKLSELFPRWNSDSFIGPIFKKEKLRRASGGQIIPDIHDSIFSTSHYAGLGAGLGGAAVAQDARSSEVISNTGKSRDVVFSNTGQATIGILLPLTGKYAAHASKVKHGIELAAAQSLDSAKIQLRIADTAGNPQIAVNEYERLVNDEQVDIVLGPLLVATTEEVSKRSSQAGVPILSFSKREGIPQLDRTVYRLGATSESQVKDLLRYTSEQLGLTRYAVIHPKTSTGVEFANIFKTQVNAFGGNLVASESYKGGVPVSAAEAVKKVENTLPEAIFIPDTLDYALPVLKSLNISNANNALLLGQAQWSDPVAIRGYGKLLDRAVFVSLFNPVSKSFEVRSFVDSYRQKFSREPELLAAQSFDAANVAINSILSGDGSMGSAGGELGVTGFLEVLGDGEISRKMSVMRLRGGSLVEVMLGGNPAAVEGAAVEGLSTP